MVQNKSTERVREKYGYGRRKIFQNKVRVRRQVRTFFGFRSTERVQAEITLGIQVRNGDGYSKNTKLERRQTPYPSYSGE